jgi:predicted DNA-binding antitoxin AbrB/MazE fold protein
MIRTVDAIYENGLFKPLEDVDLPNQEKVRLLFLLESEIAWTMIYLHGR